MAKRKNKTLKRVVAKSGQVYFFKGGKRIATKKGEKLFRKEIVNNLRPTPSNLTPSEELFLKRSQAAKKAAANTYKFQGRPIPRIYAVLMQKLFQMQANLIYLFIFCRFVSKMAVWNA